MAAGRITLREAQVIAYVLEHGRYPDAETAEWFERRASRAAVDFLFTARHRGTIGAPDAVEPRQRRTA